VRKPTDGSFKAVHNTLLDIVTLSLDSDKKLLPRSAKSLPALAAASAEDVGHARTPAETTSDDSETSTPDATKPHFSPQIPGLDTLDLDLDLDRHANRGTMQGGGEDADVDGEDDNDDDGRDPDDFSIMNETQAKRIVAMCEMAFGVEISPDAVLADANVGLLARRVVGQRSLAVPKGIYGGAGAKVS